MGNEETNGNWSKGIFSGIMGTKLDWRRLKFRNLAVKVRRESGRLLGKKCINVNVSVMNSKIDSYSIHLSSCIKKFIRTLWIQILAFFILSHFSRGFLRLCYSHWKRIIFSPITHLSLSSYFKYTNFPHI